MYINKITPQRLDNKKGGPMLILHSSLCNTKKSRK